MESYAAATPSDPCSHNFLHSVTNCQPTALLDVNPAWTLSSRWHFCQRFILFPQRHPTYHSSLERRVFKRSEERDTTDEKDSRLLRWSKPVRIATDTPVEIGGGRDIKGWDKGGGNTVKDAERLNESFWAEATGTAARRAAPAAFAGKLRSCLSHGSAGVGQMWLTSVLTRGFGRCMLDCRKWSQNNVKMSLNSVFYYHFNGPMCHILRNW